MTDTLWRAQEVQTSCGGKIIGASDWSACGVSINSRSIKPGDMFIAIKGPNHDGHAFVADAFARGAVAAIVSSVPDDMPENANLLVVGDTQKALEDLGQSARYHMNSMMIGVTGTVGKTGTKQMLATVLSGMGKTHASEGGLNNHWGVPLSLASMPKDCDYGIIEMGMNHAGEISQLTRQVKPKIAIITEITPTHTEFLGDIHGVVQAKSEIFEGMGPDGVAILNRDNEFYPDLVAAAKTNGVGKIRSFGEHEKADARLIRYVEASNGTMVTARIFGEDVTYQMAWHGKHIAMNSLSVLLAVSIAGGDVKEAVRTLSEVQPVQGRGDREFLDLGDSSNPVTLINETSNASPASMKAAFRVLAMIDPGRGGRLIAVLGDMLELGKKAVEHHTDLALPLRAANIDLVYTCGSLMKKLHDTLPANQRGGHAKDSEALAQIVPDVLIPGDVVMVKGSRGSKMDTVVEAMRALPESKGSKKAPADGENEYAV